MFRGRRRPAAVLAGSALLVAGIAALPARAADAGEITLADNHSRTGEFTVFELAGIGAFESISVRPGAKLTVTAPAQTTLAQATASFDVDTTKTGPHQILDATALGQSVSSDGRTLTLVLPSSVSDPAGSGQLYLEGAKFTGDRASLGAFARVHWATKVVAGATADEALPLKTRIRLPVGSDTGQTVIPGQKLTLRLPTGDATQTALGDPDLANAQVTVVEENLDGEFVKYRNADLGVVVAGDHRSLTLTVPARIQASGGAYSLRVSGQAADVDLLEWRTDIAPFRSVKATRIGLMRVDAKGHATFYLSGPLAKGGGAVAAAQSVAFGRKGDVPFVGDWDGDGTATVGVFRPSDGTWYLAGRNVAGGSPVTVVPFGRGTDRPVVGKFGSDAKRTSIGVFRNGTFFLALTPTKGSATKSVKLGQAGDLPLAGDWNGDGVEEVTIYRPATRTFFFGDLFTTVYGKAGDVPLLQDRAARGYASYGVFRPSTSTSVLDAAYRFGKAGDQPFTFTP